EGKIPREREENVLAQIATLGAPQDLSMILDQVVDGDAALPTGRRAVLLFALEQAMRQRKARPAGDLGRVGRLLASGSQPVRVAAARLAGLWQVESLRPQLLEYARAATAGDALRQAAVEGLALLGGQASREALT